MTKLDEARAILIGRVLGMAERIRQKGGIAKLSRGMMCVILEDLLIYPAEYQGVRETSQKQVNHEAIR